MLAVMDCIQATILPELAQMAELVGGAQHYVPDGVVPDGGQAPVGLLSLLLDCDTALKAAKQQVCSQETPDQRQQSQEAQVLQELQQAQQHKRELLQEQNELNQLEQKRRVWQEQCDQLQSQVDEVNRRGERNFQHSQRLMMRRPASVHAVKQAADQHIDLRWELQQLQQALDRMRQKGGVFEQLIQRERHIQEVSGQIQQQLKQLQQKWGKLQLQRKQQHARAALLASSNLKELYLSAASAAVESMHLLLQLVHAHYTSTGEF
jgi:chromosome segregation ATPase